jgi:predicted ABC-type ATPase
VPDLIIIAGPNGAGKTTFAREYLSADEMRFVFVNADEIARISVLETGIESASDIRAGRIMLDRIDQLVDANVDFVIETTLASLTYARKILVWRERGYNVSLVYLRLGSIAESLARVRRRVEAGGHSIPAEAIERRFGKSNSYFETIYKPIVNAWYVWESREGRFVLVNSSETQ